MNSENEQALLSAEAEDFILSRIQTTQGQINAAAFLNGEPCCRITDSEGIVSMVPSVRLRAAGNTKTIQ